MRKPGFLGKVILILICASMLLSLTACGETKMYQAQIFAMDVVMTLTAYGNNAEAGLSAAASVIKSMDQTLDPELETSTVYAINHAQGANVTVSGQIANMLNKTTKVYNRTNGAIDLSIYPVLKRWGFIDAKYYVPTGEELMEDLARLCYDKLVLTSFPGSGSYSVSLPSYGMISFGAVAKGCASDNAVSAMRQQGVTSGIISLGGNVQTLGLKPDGSNWTVAIQDPKNDSSYVGVVSVGETAVITSGTNQRFFTDNRGRKYHHLINPATGIPVTNTLQSVTIICPDGTMADCLSTAMFVYGESKSLNYWRTYGREDNFEMILITTDSEIICTKGLIEKFTLSNSNYTLKYVE